MRTTPRVAGFRSEYPAGFELECMAGFVGIRIRGDRFSDWRGNQALSNGLFAGQLVRAPNGVGFLSRRSD